MPTTRDVEELIATARRVVGENPMPEGELCQVTQVHHGPRSSTVVAEIRVGGGLRPHVHDNHDEVIVFLEGEADFRIGDQMRRVAAGDVISVPAGVVHATVRARTPCLLAATFAPGFDPHPDREDRRYVDG